MSKYTHMENTGQGATPYPRDRQGSCPPTFNLLVELIDIFEIGYSKAYIVKGKQSAKEKFHVETCKSSGNSYNTATDSSD